MQPPGLKIWAMTILWALLATGAEGQPPGTPRSPVDPAHEALVQKLGDPSFRIREMAARQLLDIGLPARTALMEALNSIDLETRMGAHRVLVRILQSDFDSQLKVFVQGVGDDRVDLPGWNLFSRTVGDSAATRRLFADMIRNEADLLEQLEEGAESLKRLFEQRVTLLSNASRVGSSQHLTIPSLATLLFISQQPEVRSTTTDVRLYSFLVHRSMKQEILEGPHFPVVEKLLSKWVSSGGSQHYALRVALAFELKPAGLELARKMLASDATMDSAIAYAAIVVVRFGEPADVKLLLPHLDNTTVFHSWHNMQLKKEPIRIQVRDAVLALAIRLTGQQPEDYGFKLLRSDPDTIYKIYTLGFLEDAEREAALKKWRAWSETHADQLAYGVPPPAAGRGG